MSDYFPPIAFAAALWWLTTGLLLYLDRRPQRTFPISLVAATFVLFFALYGVRVTSSDTSVTGAYLAFICSILVWGWLEMTFLMGFITGPRRHASSARAFGWRRLVHAIQAILYHELAIIVAAVVLFALTRAQPNQLALWTFTALWTMRLSAKLNLFLGVPNLGEQFLPEHLRYLGTYFRRRSMNLLFPLSATAGTVATMYVAQLAFGSTTEFELAAFALLGALLALGVLEHWFLVVPLPSAALWKWTVDASASPHAESRHD